jgi:CDP-glucose 4,6-dehydratase
VRPWQHVLASLDGYLRLAQRLYLEENTDMFEAWNFGPSEQDIHSVEEVAKEVSRIWGGGAIDSNGHRNPVEYREANLLQLDSAKARTRLGWAPPWDLKASLEKTVEWHRAFLRGDPVKELCLRQIGEYEQGR